MILTENNTCGLKVLLVFFLSQVPWSNQAVPLFVLVEEQCFVSNEYFPVAVLHICGLAVKV